MRRAVVLVLCACGAPSSPGAPAVDPSGLGAASLPAEVTPAPETPPGAGTEPTEAPPAGAVELGKPAPPFRARTQDGVEIDLAKAKGKPVVLYFYPRDETPGCTKQACAFRDAWGELAKRDVVLIGVSTDTDESHRAFAKRHDLPFHLVSDPRGEIAALYGVPLENGVLARQTFIVGKDGDVIGINRAVEVSHQVSEVLAALDR